MSRRKSLIERIRFDESGCWIWTGKRTPEGYGHHVIWQGSKPLYRAAHRFVYEQFVGPIPEGLQLDHLCRVKECVNPAHLEPVTPRENTARYRELISEFNPRTHCHRGHEYTPGNVYYRPGVPGRHCRACGVISTRAYLERKKNKAVA